MNQNIEPGCLALVVRHPVDENNGKVVTVGRCLGKIPCDSDNHSWIGIRWEIDWPIQAHSQLQKGPADVYAMHIDEVCLLRIDGYNESLTDHHALEQAL